MSFLEYEEEERSICLDCLTVFSFPDSLLISSTTRPGSISEIDIITSGGLAVGVGPPPGVGSCSIRYLGQSGRRKSPGFYQNLKDC